MGNILRINLSSGIQTQSTAGLAERCIEGAGLFQKSTGMD
jgi:hypothetical protein